jgi:hypothetical protein
VLIAHLSAGMPYLDVIRRLREVSALPIAAYHVSGEYAMLKAAAQNVSGYCLLLLRRSDVVNKVYVPNNAHARPLRITRFARFV